MNKTKYLLRDGIIIIIVLVIIIILYGPWRKDFIARIPFASVITEKIDYKTGEIVRIKIENNFDDNICFSSCYPYYLEKREDNWQAYRYIDCPYEDMAENCIEPGQIKGFETVLPYIKNKGLHRLALSACLGCEFREDFKGEKWFYSNHFTID